MAEKHMINWIYIKTIFILMLQVGYRGLDKACKSVTLSSAIGIWSVLYGLDFKLIL